MKQITLKSSCIITLLFTVLYCKAQLNPSFNVRDKHITQHYQLSPQQVNDYNKILCIIESQWNAIKDTKSSVANRKSAEKKLNEEFCIKVEKLFSKEQYNKWNENHRGNLRVRFYKEDLGMTSRQYAEYRKISKTYSNAKANIIQMNLSNTEEIKRREDAFEIYSSSLHNAFPAQLANYLIYENEVQNAAMTLSRRYTIISENKAIKFAVLKIQYDKNRGELDAQNLSTQKLRQERKNLEDKYESSLKSFMTNDEYIICAKTRDKLTDKKYMHIYRMSPTQLAHYKELKKELAMKQLMIKQSRMEKTAKLTRLQEAELSFEQQLQKKITPEQFARWKKDISKKRSKNK